MNSGKKLFICSCAVLALGIINLNISPTYNGRVSTWNLLNCAKMSDDIKEAKKSDIPQSIIDNGEAKLTQCIIQKSMYMIEQSVFVINIGIGFICVLLGLFGLEKESSKKSGIIGLSLGIIGAILSFIYVIFNGIVYTNYYDNYYDKNKSIIYKIDENGAFAVYSYDNKYKCLYFNKENDEQALIAKFSDLIKSRYNYDKEMNDAFFSERYNEKNGCNRKRDPSSCRTDGFIEGPINYYTDSGEKQCTNLYYYEGDSSNTNYDVSARFLAALILSLFTVICYCALIFSGFMILKES